jgi:hypothetical protein
MQYMTREEWLTNLAQKLRPIFEQCGVQYIPRIRISCGFPTGCAVGKGKRIVGECFSSVCSADHTNEIFVSPTVSDSLDAGGILIHEIIHAIVGTHEGHKGPFVTLARAVGLKGKPTATNPGKRLTRRLNALIGELGPYPHATLSFLQIKKDGTRLIKVVCPSCGYTVRATRKWLEIGSPICPTDKIQMESDI